MLVEVKSEEVGENSFCVSLKRYRCSNLTQSKLVVNLRPVSDIKIQHVGRYVLDTLARFFWYGKVPLTAFGFSTLHSTYTQNFDPHNYTCN